MGRFLVTGGAGFIGSHLVDALLARGDQARVIDDLSTGKRDNLDPRAELAVGDIADLAAVQQALDGCDGCFNLAAVASVERGNQDWLGTHRANLTGTVTVFEAARRRRLPVVYASSAAIYGDNDALPLDEAARPRPLSAYGADKLGCELHARVATEVHGVPTVGLRFFNVFGPRQDPKSPYSGVISIFCDRLAAGQGVTINGDGTQTRDFIHVSDVVRHLLAAMDRRPPGAPVFNVCTGRPTSILALAQAIGRVLAREPSIGFAAPRAGDVRASLGNPARAAAALGVRAETGLEAGLRTILC